MNRQHIPGVVDHGHMVHAQPLYRVGYQHLDCIDRLGGWAAHSSHGEKHGRRGVPPRVDEQPVFRANNHDTRRIDPVELGDCAGQFSLHRPVVIGVLHEVRHAKRVLVQQFIPDAFAFGDPLCRELHSHLVHLRRRHVNRTSPLAYLVLDAARIKCLGDPTGLCGIEIAVQERIVCSPPPYEHGDQCCDDRKTGCHHRNLLIQAKLVPYAGQLLQ